jgi:hypothetical protein
METIDRKTVEMLGAVQWWIHHYIGEWADKYAALFYRGAGTVLQRASEIRLSPHFATDGEERKELIDYIHAEAELREALNHHDESRLTFEQIKLKNKMNELAEREERARTDAKRLYEFENGEQQRK